MIATNIEQSKKLVELGIDVNTADMFWDLLSKDKYAKVNNIGNCLGRTCVYAWSLSALLGLMPKLYEEYNDSDDSGCQPNLCKGWDNNQWHIVYRSSIYITEWYNDPIDAAFEMVCWLKENKYI